MEIFKGIKGFENYQVSNYGNVKSLKNNIILKPSISSGYYMIALCKDGKKHDKRVHRLVAEAFLENPNNYKEVNHKDECKTNSHVSNLEWCDRKYNINYGTGVQRSSEKRSKRVDQIDKVTKEVVRQWASTNECDRNGFNHGNVAACARGKLKQYKGYIWKYVTETITH